MNSFPQMYPEYTKSLWNCTYRVLMEPLLKLHSTQMKNLPEYAQIISQFLQQRTFSIFSFSYTFWTFGILVSHFQTPPFLFPVLNT